MKLNHHFWTSLLIASVVSLSSCKNQSDAETPTAAKPQTVSTEKLASTSTFKTINLSGNIEGQTTVNLSFMVPGKVDRVYAAEGQVINRGNLLASLEATSYVLSRKLAEIQVKKATDEYQRLKIMYEKNSLSESDFKKAEFAVEESKNHLLMQNKTVNDTKVYSPISGILLAKKCENGEMVDAGRPVLTIADIAKVKVIAYLPENLLGQIKIGQSAAVSIAAVSQTFEGKVVEIAGVADQSTRTFVIKIEVNNARGTIRPGMIAEANITKATMDSSITVPTAAVLNSNDNRSFVFVIDREKKKAFKRDVTIGVIAGNRIEILSGVSPNEEIVVKGQQKLVDGTSININN